MSATRKLTVTIAAGADHSTPVAINNARSVGFGVTWVAAITDGAYALEFIPTSTFSTSHDGTILIGPFAAPSANRYDCDAVGVAAYFCRVKRTTATTGANPVFNIFLHE